MSLAIRAARLRLERDRPYLAQALWSLQLVERPGIGTLAVDEWWRLYYDPEALERWDQQLDGVLYHEICHLLREHADRLRAVEDHDLANRAADAEINDDLLEEGVELPGGMITPDSLGFPSHRLAEEYVELLSKTPRDQTPGGGAGQGGGGGESRADQSSALAGAGPNRQGDCAAAGSSPAATQGVTGSLAATGGGADGSMAAPGPATPPLPSPAPGQGRCGSCATGHREAWEDGPPAGGNAPGLSRVEGQLTRRAVAEAVRREASRGIGTVPGHMGRWADALLSPRVDWRRELAASFRRAVAQAAGAVDYSYRRPSRRQGCMGDVVVPSLHCPVPEVAMVVDTSGSMGTDQMSFALAEVRGVLQACGGGGVRVLSCDALAGACRRVFRAGQVELVGGGGTDMGAGIAAALALRPRPEVVIVVTDGETPWPDAAPPARVIVVVVGAGTCPPWAKEIRYE